MGFVRRLPLSTIKEIKMNLKTTLKLLSLLLFVIVLISCEAQKHINLVVLNKQTNAPIDSVFVKVTAGKGDDFTKSGDEGYTNSTGKYETYIMIGCSGGCYDIKINYDKEGFKTVETMNQIKDTVYLIPVKN